MRYFRDMDRAEEAFQDACLRALKNAAHQVTMGFDKTWGLDVLYPQGGLYEGTAIVSAYCRPSHARHRKKEKQSKREESQNGAPGC